MDKIWDRKCFEIGGHWPLMKKRMTTQKQQKSNARKKHSMANGYVCMFTIV